MILAILLQCIIAIILFHHFFFLLLSMVPELLTILHQRCVCKAETGYIVLYLLRLQAFTGHLGVYPPQIKAGNTAVIFMRSRSDGWES